MSLKLCALIPDSHRPYHHVKAYNLVLQVLKALKPAEIYLKGDYGDFYFVNAHGKHPSMLTTLVEEVASIEYGLNELDHLFPDAKKTYVCGNHEWRLERYIQNVCPALFGITDIEHILKLVDRPNWRFIPWTGDQQVSVGGSRLLLRHRPLASSAKAGLNKAMVSYCYGDNHRIEQYKQVALDGTQHVAFSCGWLGDKKFDKVFGYIPGQFQWQLGFGLVWVDTVTKNFSYQIVEIDENDISCVVNGKRYKA